MRCTCMATVKYNFDETFTIKNKITGNKFVNNITDKKIYLVKAGTGKKSLLADFCITDLVWNDSNKDIDNVKLNGTGGATDYAIGSNATALKNRIFKESFIGSGQVLPSSTDKKFQQFAVNDLLYEMILTIVYKIQDNSLPVGTENVTLTITSSDTASFTNGTVTVTATDESSTAVQGLKITGSIGETAVSGTTDSSGQVSTTLTSAGTFAISVESEATTAYKAASKTGSVTVTAITAEPGDG